MSVTVRRVAVPHRGFWHRSSLGGPWRFTRLPYKSVPAPASYAPERGTGSPAGAGTTNDRARS